MRKFRDLEFDIIITEEELLRTFKHLQREQPDKYDYSIVDRECAFANDEIQEEIDSWSEDEEDNEEEN